MTIKGKEILLIEDEPELNSVLAESLAEDEAIVDVAASVADSIKCLSSKQFACVVCDANLPDGDYNSVLAVVQSTQNPTCKFVLMSGEPKLQDSVSDAIAAFLLKPDEINELGEKLAKLLES